MSAIVSYRCPRCEKYLAESEIKQIKAGSGFMKACMTCGGAIAEERSREARSLPGLLVSAFGYPFRGSMVLWSIAMIVGTTVLSFAPMFGGILAASAELGFLFAVLKSTADGKDEIDVNASDLADVSMWIRPFAKYVVAAILSFGPAAAALFLLAPAKGEPPVVALVLGGLGLLYFPAALVVAAHETGGAVINPVAGFRLIARIPGSYFLTVFFVGIAMAVGGATIRAALLLDVPVLGAVARSVASLYGPIVAMRMLGLLVQENAESL